MAETTVKTNPLYYIRQKGLDCSAGSSHEVELCPVKDCPLFPMRFGKNPFRTKRVLTEKQREAQRKNLEKARANQKRGK